MAAQPSGVSTFVLLFCIYLRSSVILPYTLFNSGGFWWSFHRLFIRLHCLQYLVYQQSSCHLWRFCAFSCPFQFPFLRCFLIFLGTPFLSSSISKVNAGLCHFCKNTWKGGMAPPCAQCFGQCLCTLWSQGKADNSSPGFPSMNLLVCGSAGSREALLFLTMSEISVCVFCCFTYFSDVNLHQFLWHSCQHDLFCNTVLQRVQERQCLTLLCLVLEYVPSRWFSEFHFNRGLWEIKKEKS